MYIKNLKLQNFRNINNCNIDFDKKINLIIGENAHGKTNFLEAIYYSNFYKSFRTKNKIDLINIFENNFYIEINCLNNISSNNLKFYLDKKNEKKTLLNNKKPEVDILFKTINTIIYYPSEINLLNLYPLYRRNLIDRSIFFINNKYINEIKTYNKILKQRNIFLKNHESKYDPWKDQLIDKALEIIKNRINYIERLNNKFKVLHSDKKINEKYFIKYKKYKKENIINILNNDYNNVKEKEKHKGYTLFGPHIEDFDFFINDNNIKKYSSEGQKKFFLLHYKYVQLLDYHDHNKCYPILLYDDLGSELDTKRKNIYFERILKNSGQIFLTSTNCSEFVDKETKVFNIFEGKITDL